MLLEVILNEPNGNLNHQSDMDLDIDYDELQKNHQPEYGLIASILYRALLDITRPESHINKAAYVWCLSNQKKRPGAFTFIEICELLEIDKVYLRTQIKQLYEAVKKKENKKSKETRLFYLRLRKYAHRQYRFI